VTLRRTAAVAPPRTRQGITELLQAWSRGDAAAGEALYPLVFADLRRRARRYLRRERREHTLQPTALVHEAYIRLVDQRVMAWQNRAHFFGVAAQMMRRILVDHARAYGTGKRGGAWSRIPLQEDAAVAGPPDADLVALDAALVELSALDAQQSRIVELRFFGGLSIEEAAEVLGISPATVKRDWSVARAWLFRRIQTGASP
jgi:RNA polymerase sigma-70 factor, ECF subfamily